MAILILAYFVYLIIMAIFNLAIFYHAWKFSYPKDATRVVMSVYLISMIGIVVVSLILLGII